MTLRYLLPIVSYAIIGLAFIWSMLRAAATPDPKPPAINSVDHHNGYKEMQ